MPDFTHQNFNKHWKLNICSLFIGQNNRKCTVVCGHVEELLTAAKKNWEHGWVERVGHSNVTQPRCKCVPAVTCDIAMKKSFNAFPPQTTNINETSVKTSELAQDSGKNINVHVPHNVEVNLEARKGFRIMQNNFNSNDWSLSLNLVSSS